MTTAQPTLVAFHGQQATKDEYLARVEAHRAADDFTRNRREETEPDKKGHGRWRGDASHCTLHASRDAPAAGETQLGLPGILTQALDSLFQEVSPERFAAWPGQFLAAIPVGADLSRVWPQLAVWLLTDAQMGVVRFAQTDSQREAIQEVANRYRQVLDGAEDSYEQWVALRKETAAVEHEASEIARRASTASFYKTSPGANYAAEAAVAQAASDATDAALRAAYFDVIYAIKKAASAASQIALATVHGLYNPYSHADEFATAYAETLRVGNAHADSVADKLLELLAAAPVPVARPGGRHRPRAVAVPAMLAFHGQQATKDSYLTRLETHRAAGDIIRDRFYGRSIGDGYYGWTTEDRKGKASGWRGGASGCAFHDNNDPHKEGELLIGLPRDLGRLLDAVFMGLPPERFAAWPGEFLAAIPVGADLARVWPQLALWLLTEGPDSLLSLAQTDGQRAAIQAVADLYAKVHNGRKVSVKTWLAAYKAAAGAAEAVAATYATPPAYVAHVAAGYAVSAAAYAAVAATGIMGACNISGGVANAHASALASAATATARAAAIRAFPTRYLPDDDAYDKASDNYYNMLANKILGLMAAAPVFSSKPFRADYNR